MIARTTLGSGAASLEVSALGLGAMVLSGMYAPPDPVEARATFERALELGIDFVDTADAYSDGANEELVGELLHGRRERVVLATKFGLRRDAPGEPIRIDSSAEYARRCIDASLRRLRTDRVDLWYVHRLSADVPVEETVGAMAEQVAAGKVRGIGLCEVDGETLERAHRVHPVTAVQSEWSLWERAIERVCLPVARRLGVGIVPYGPLGRGFFTGAIAGTSSFAAGDLRAGDPRFSAENLAANQRLLDVIDALAAAKGASKAQVALAWLKAQGDDVVPIPGTEKRVFLEDNAGCLDVRFSDDELARLHLAFPEGVAAGNADGVHLRAPRAPVATPATSEAAR